MQLSTRYRFGFREFVDLGGFLAVGPSYSDLYRRAGSYLDKIQEDEACRAPVEQLSKSEFIFNLSPETCHSLGDAREAPREIIARTAAELGASCR